MRIFQAMEALTGAVVEGCPPERFVRLAQGLLASARPGLIVADLAESAVLLGRFQRRWSAAPEPGRVVRRMGGGRALEVGPGTVAVCVVVPSPTFSPDKTMNRCVRSLLHAIGAVARKPAHYFGRDAVVMDGREVAIVSQEGLDPVLFEAYVSVKGMPAGRYPPHGDPRIAERTLGGLGDVPFAAFAAELMAAYAAQPGPPPEEGPLPAPSPDEREGGFRWSGWVDVPIGFVEAMVGHGVVRLRGDFIAPYDRVVALEQRLASASRAGLREAAADAFAGAYLHGVDDPTIFADAVMAAG
jgi:hypothetical protein